MGFGVSSRSVMLTAYHFVIWNERTASEICLMTSEVKPVFVPKTDPDVPKTDRGVRLVHS